MKYIVYEIRKLIGIRYIWIFAAMLFASNIALAAYTANKVPPRIVRIPQNIVSDFFDMYSNNPDQIKSEYDELSILNDERNALIIEAGRMRNFDFEPDPLPNKYTDSEFYDDMALFGEVFDRQTYIKNYPRTVQRVIDRAYINIDEFDIIGVKSDSFAYKYQLKIIELYKAAQVEVNIGFEYNRGWQEFFNYDILNIFIFAILIMIGSAVFAQEKSSGFIAIIKTAKNGRTKTAVAKIGAMLILTLLIVLLFVFSTLAVFGIVLGLSSTGNAIQVFQDFLLSPVVVTVGQYLLINIGIKALVFSLFSCMVLLISTFIHSYAMIYLCGFGVFGLNFLLYTINFISADHPVRNLNFVAVAAVKPLYIRYRAINFFENMYGYIPFMIISFSLFAIVFSIITIMSYNNNQSGLVIGRFTLFSKTFNKIRNFVSSTIEKILDKLPKKKNFSLSVFSAEIYKTLISKRYILIVIALIILKVYMSTSNFTPAKSYSDSVYKEYMITLEGDLTDEKREFITAERNLINTALAQKDAINEQYSNGTINFMEYWDFMEDYNYAYTRNELFTIIENHRDYIDQIAEQKEKDAWFVYDTGWRSLLHNGFDIILYVSILLLFAGIFSDEYASKSSSGGFAQILRSTKNGRNRTFVSKLVASVLISAVLTIIFNAVDIIFVFKNYNMPALNAPLLSVQSFSSTNGGITLLQYLIVFVLMRLAGNILFALFVFGLSEILKKSVFVMGVAMAVTLFPALFAYFGLDLFKYFDFTGLLSGTQLYLLSAVANWAQDIGLLAVFMIVTGVILFALILKSRRDYAK